MKHRLRWLGHMAHMESDRLPKQLLFGELVKRRPSHVVKRRWHDVAAADLKAISVEDWYNIAQDRKAWRAICSDGLASLVDRHRYGVCATNLPAAPRTTNHLCRCGRSFCRQGDLTRHSHFCSTGASMSSYSLHHWSRALP